ncbi:WhiB family transcriptional regulator [Kitasatospora kifunensis]|uniref:WhiB family transcriptional regulator n=1 Tax=Kitasatospora kifunensis TaxID=58351 RepID=UPI0035E46562
MERLSRVKSTKSPRRLKISGTAPCQDPDVDPEVFFPAGKDVVARALAVSLCRGCDMVDECLSWALDNPSLTQLGIWGATTPSQRKSLRSLRE